ncbi:MAG: hypothetical protein WA096_02490 [Smithella sp.]
MAIFSVLERHSTTGENGKEKELAFRRVMRVTERAIDKKGVTDSTKRTEQWPCHKNNFCILISVSAFTRGQLRPANAGGIQFF